MIRRARWKAQQEMGRLKQNHKKKIYHLIRKAQKNTIEVQVEVPKDLEEWAELKCYSDKSQSDVEESTEDPTIVGVTLSEDEKNILF